MARKRMTVPYHVVEFGDEEVAAVLAEFEANWFSSRGPRVAEFGAAWAEKIGCSFGVPTSGGTGAIHCGLAALGVGPGVKVAVPTYTCCPSVFPVTWLGGEPVFVDCETATYGLDPQALDTVLALDPLIRHVLVVHLYAGGCLDAVFDVCERHGVLVLEDACEVTGATYRNHSGLLGSRGDVGCFSFRGDKIITTLGAGGCAVTDDAETHHLIQLLSDTGFDLEYGSVMDRYNIDVLGFAYEMANPAAAFGLAQIHRLPVILEARRERAGWYFELLSPLVDQGLIGLTEHYAGGAWFRFPVSFLQSRGRRNLVELAAYFADRGIDVYPPFTPMHAQPVYSGVNSMLEFPNAYQAWLSVLTLPCYPALSREQVEYVGKAVAGAAALLWEAKHGY